MENGRNSVARGTVYLACSSAFFVICAYVTHSLLGRLLHPDNYGIFGLVISILVWIELALEGISGATVKMVAERHTSLRESEKHSVALLLSMGVVVFLAAFFAAPLLERVFDQPDLSFYLRVAIVDIIFISVLRAYMALLNGMKLYGKQSISTTVYVLMKLVFMVGLVALGFSVSGALAGNIVASAVGLVASFVFFRRSSRLYGNEWPAGSGNGAGFKLLVATAVPFTIFTLLYNSIMNIDLWMVQGLMHDSTETGYYVAAVNLAKALYFILSALSLAVFPAIAGSIHQGDHARTRDYIRRSFRTLFIALVPISIFMAVSSARLVDLVYSSSYSASAGPLVILSFGYAFLAVLIACFTILIANNSFKEVLIVQIALVALDVILCAVLIPPYGLNGAACSTLATSLAGFVVSVIIVRRNLGVSPEAYCFLRTLSASIIASVILWIPGSGVLLLLYYVLAGTAYLMLLWFLGELKRKDIEALKAVFSRDR